MTPPESGAPTSRLTAVLGLALFGRDADAVLGLPSPSLCIRLRCSCINSLCSTVAMSGRRRWSLSRHLATILANRASYLSLGMGGHVPLTI